MSRDTLRIDGRTLEFAPGESLLGVAHRAGIDVPSLCSAPGLAPRGGCRLCLVEIEGETRRHAACHTAARAGLVVRSESTELFQLRRGLLELQLAAPAWRPGPAAGRFGELLARHGLGAPAATAATQAPDLAAPIGAAWPLAAAVRATLRSDAVDARHPYLRFDAGRCILCRRCVSACDEIQGQGVYAIGGRGGAARLWIGPEDDFRSSGCVACGACVDQCPSGALGDRDREAGVENAAERATESVCGYCGVGCRIRVWSGAGRVQRIEGVGEAEVNRGHLCAKGRYAHAWQASPERLREPLLRRAGGGFEPVSWERALDFLGGRLRALRERHGPDSLGLLTSSRSTNEAAYLLQKLFRSVLGTNNVDCCARVCHSSTAQALRLATGAGAASASYLDIEAARCIVLAGANPTEAHPVVGARIRQARRRGARLVVIDPRRIELAAEADLHLQLVPGTNVALFDALAAALIERGAVDRDYLAQRVEGYEGLRDFLATHSPALWAQPSGIGTAQLNETLRLLCEGPVLFVHGLGLSELFQGTDSVLALANLALLTGSIGRAGAGLLPLRGQNNVQGNADMGALPDLAPGYQPLADEAVRERMRRLWGAPAPSAPGSMLPEMLEAARAGALRGLWVQGEDLVQSDPDTAKVREALAALDFLVVQELFLTETARHAQLVLPAAGYLEQDGTFTNAERRIQRVRRALPPPGEARPDWQVAVLAARALGADWDYADPAAVMREIAAFAPDLFGGVDYARLDGDGLQWPCPVASHPGTVRLHEAGFTQGRARLFQVEYTPSAEHGQPEFPYLLITGRQLAHYNVGTMTRRTPQQDLLDEDRLEIHPVDARREGIGDGDGLHVESRYGRVRLRAEHSARVAPGTLFLSFHQPETQANGLVGPVRDPRSGCPQYKCTAVRLARLPDGN